MRLALILVSLLASGLAAAAKPQPFQAETTATVRAIAARQRAVGTTMLGAMRTVQRLAKATSTNVVLPISAGLHIRALPRPDGKYSVTLANTVTSRAIIDTSGGVLPRSGMGQLGQRVLNEAPSMTPALIEQQVRGLLDRMQVR